MRMPFGRASPQLPAACGRPCWWQQTPESCRASLCPLGAQAGPTACRFWAGLFAAAEGVTQICQVINMICQPS